MQKLKSKKGILIAAFALFLVAIIVIVSFVLANHFDDGYMDLIEEFNDSLINGDSERLLELYYAPPEGVCGSTAYPKEYFSEEAFQEFRNQEELGPDKNLLHFEILPAETSVLDHREDRYDTLVNANPGPDGNYRYIDENGRRVREKISKMVSVCCKVYYYPHAREEPLLKDFCMVGTFTQTAAKIDGKWYFVDFYSFNNDDDIQNEFIGDYYYDQLHD